MKNAREIQELIAQAQTNQREAANEALLPGRTKADRSEARAKFLYLSGQVQGLLDALGEWAE